MWKALVALTGIKTEDHRFLPTFSAFRHSLLGVSLRYDACTTASFEKLWFFDAVPHCR